jgi:hypothetical protein
MAAGPRGKRLRLGRRTAAGETVRSVARQTKQVYDRPPFRTSIPPAARLASSSVCSSSGGRARSPAISRTRACATRCRETHPEARCLRELVPARLAARTYKARNLGALRCGTPAAFAYVDASNRASAAPCCRAVPTMPNRPRTVMSPLLVCRQTGTELRRPRAGICVGTCQIRVPPRVRLVPRNLERRALANAHASPAVASTQPVVAGVVATDEWRERALDRRGRLLGLAKRRRGHCSA